MKIRVKKQIYFGIILVMISGLFFSCSSSKKAAYAASAKYAARFDEDRFKSMYYNGLKQKVLGNYSEALDFFRSCLTINPASPAANFELSEILEYNKHTDSSLVYMGRAVNGDPGNIWYRYFYAQNLQELGRYKDMVKVYEDLIKLYPGNTDIYYKLALAQLQAAQYKEAVETYTTLEKKLGSVDEDIAMSKIEVLEKIKEYTKAEEEIQKLIKNDPSTPQYYDMLGNLYELEGKSNKAFDEFKKMEELYPHDAMVHLSLADYYKTQNQDVKAYEELEKAFDEPELDVDTKIRIILGLSTFTNSDTIYNEAMTLSRKMVAAAPNEPKAHAVYAELLIHGRNLNEARNQYRIAVGEDSSKYAYWSGLLTIEGELNAPDDLANESKKAIGLFPTNGELYYYNGVANLQLRKFDEALNSFKSGLFYVNDSDLRGKFYSNIGDVNYYIKHFSSSDSAYEEALKINPNNDYVLNNYSYYLSVRDTNLALAEKMSKKSNELRLNNYEYEDTYGWILYVSGKYQDAKEWEYKAIMNGGNVDPTILEHYGDILFKTDQKDSAVDYWIKAKEKGANSELLERKIKDKQLYTK